MHFARTPWVLLVCSHVCKTRRHTTTLLSWPHDLSLLCYMFMTCSSAQCYFSTPLFAPTHAQAQAACLTSRFSHPPPENDCPAEHRVLCGCGLLPTSPKQLFLVSVVGQKGLCPTLFSKSESGKALDFQRGIGSLPWYSATFNGSQP